MKNKYGILFWAAEAILLLGAGVFAFAMVGYSTMALVLCGMAALAGLYRLLYCYSFKNRKRSLILKRILTALVIIGLALFIAVEVPIISAARTDEDPEAGYVIVLGAGVNGTVPSLTLLNRLNAAKNYLNMYPGAKAVVSGGQGPGEDISEAECMYEWLVGAGIDPGRILMENQSTSTQENLAFSLAVISADGGDVAGGIAIVSNEYHLYRAKRIAAELGVSPLGVAAKTPYPVLTLNYFIREGLAVIKMMIM